MSRSMFGADSRHTNPPCRHLRTLCSLQGRAGKDEGAVVRSWQATLLDDSLPGGKPSWRSLGRSSLLHRYLCTLDLVPCPDWVKRPRNHHTILPSWKDETGSTLCTIFRIPLLSPPPPRGVYSTYEVSWCRPKPVTTPKRDLESYPLALGVPLHPLEARNLLPRARPRAREEAAPYWAVPELTYRQASFGQ
jgi:hypothetical protein